MRHAIKKRYGRAGGKRPLVDRLFVGVYPEGIVYADRSREEHGDYARVAFLPFGTLELEVSAPKSPLLTLVRADAAKIAARRGEKFITSGNGQYIILGGRS